MKVKRPKKRKLVGIIAEDKSDISVLKSLIEKITKTPFSVEYFVGNGCGKIAGKCRSWAQNLSDSGCEYLLVVQDLDDKKVNELRRDLTAALGVSPIAAHTIIIPVREIEAWLLADHTAISKALKLHGAKLVSNPEGIRDPKRHLAELVFRWSKNKRRYVNAIDNPKIAAECSPQNLGRCPSFAVLRDFVAANL